MSLPTFSLIKEHFMGNFNVLAIEKCSPFLGNEIHVPIFFSQKQGLSAPQEVKHNNPLNRVNMKV